MPSASDDKLWNHNNIPSESPGKESQLIDDTGWVESAWASNNPSSQTYDPYIRYGFVEDGDFRQGKLRPLSDPIPPDAVTASLGIYFLTSREKYLVSQGVGAKFIQNNCEEDGRVAYTIVAESDALEDKVEAQTIIEWLIDFAENTLDLDKNEYQLYFSGHRSIHLHTDYYVPEGGLDFIKKEAQEFNQIQNAELDTGIYTSKRQFRLIGAEHQETGLYKISVPSDSDRDQLIKLGLQDPNLDIPHSLPSNGAGNNLVAGNSSRRALPDKYESRLLSKYIKDAGSQIDEKSVAHLDGSYTNRYFSPYAKTEDGERSVCVFEPVNSPFCWMETKEIRVPSIIHGARGADGEYVIRNKKAPVILSKSDFRKFEYQSGEFVVIIGGQSRSSRIFTVDKFDKDLVATELTFHEDQGS